MLIEKIPARMDFHPTSNLYLAYPTAKSATLLDLTDWSRKCVLSCPSINSDISIVQFSPCGKLLAAASQNGSIAIWNIATESLVDFCEHPNSTAICSMVWNPLGTLRIFL